MVVSVTNGINASLCMNKRYFNGFAILPFKRVKNALLAFLKPFSRIKRVRSLVILGLLWYLRKLSIFGLFRIWSILIFNGQVIWSTSIEHSSTYSFSAFFIVLECSCNCSSSYIALIKFNKFFSISIIWT